MEDHKPAIGITSDVGSGMHIVQLDYDGKTLDEVEKDVNYLIEEFSLGEAFLYKTNHGFHVKFYYDEITYKKYQKILCDSACDESFVLNTTYDGYSTLRLCGKYKGKNDIKFVKTVKSIKFIGKRQKKIGLERKEFDEGLMGLHPLLGGNGYVQSES